MQSFVGDACMVTKKEVFIRLMELIKNNVSEVDNRVYSAYPKQEPQLPFIVISNPEYVEEEFTIDDTVISFGMNVDIYLYTNTSQELDEISQKVVEVLRNNDIYSATKTIREETSVEYKKTNKIMHEQVITVELRW